MNTRLLATGLISILLISGVITLVQINNSIDDQEAEVISALENMNFTLNSLDIIGTNNSAIVVEGILIIGNITSVNAATDVDIQNVHISMYHDQKVIIETDLELDSDILITNGSREEVFTINYEVSNSTESDPFIDLLMAGELFSLNFTGTVSYSKLNVNREFDFDNSLLFNVTEGTSFEFSLDDIDIPQADGENSTVGFSVYNPFSVDVMATGNLQLYVENYFVGDLILDAVKLVSHQNSSHTVGLLLADPPYITVVEVYDNFENTYTINGSINVIIDDLNFEMQPRLNYINANSTIISAEIDSINNYTVDISRGDLSGLVDVKLLYNFPLDLNLTSMTADIQTKRGVFLGNTSWSSEVPVQLRINRTSVIYNVSIEIRGASSLTLLTIASDKMIVLRNVYAYILFFDRVLEFRLSDIPIDLSDYV